MATKISASIPGLPRTRAALTYATKLHRHQRREMDGAPFIEHPLEVASLLYAAGAPDHLIAAGLLHDVIEKTPATGFDLRRRFGSNIASLVLAVSEDAHIHGYAERKGALRHQAVEAGDEALMLFAADKVSKVRELRVEAGRPGRGRGSFARRLAFYERCLAVLREHLPGSPLVAQLSTDLAGVRCERGTRSVDMRHRRVR